jgi:RimJ/RimL family protein N-acetyltransferase
MKEVTSLGPRTLTGRFIALEPMEERHHAGLIAAAADPETWRYIPFDMSKGYAARIPDFEREIAAGRQFTYVVRRLADGEIIGSTSYLAIAADQARVEIGATWYVADARGSAVNPEAKYLLLGNAFAAGYNRVEFKTDAKNARSRAALTKLGAKEEGTLRGHMWMPQGYFRDSVYFSILAAEWPEVKAALEKRLAVFA